MEQVNCDKLVIGEHISRISEIVYAKLTKEFNVEVVDSPPIGSEKVLLDIAPELHKLGKLSVDKCLETVGLYFAEHIICLFRQQKTIYVYLPKIYGEQYGIFVQRNPKNSLPMRIASGYDIRTDKFIVWLCAQVFTIKEN